MDKIAGKKIAISNVETHRWVEDIAYFDGPLVSLMKASTSQDYIYYWCDSDRMYNRWLAFPISREQIYEYTIQSISLLEILTSNQSSFVIDIDSEGKSKKVWSIAVSDITGDYLPSEDSYFEPDLCPSGANLFISPDNYEINIDGEWFLEDLVLLPKVYSQLYAFSYTLYNLTRRSVYENAKNIFSRYPWRGGFSTVNFFKDLDRVIPSLHEPQVKELKYASPGHIRLELLSEVSKELENTIKKAIENSVGLSECYKETQKYLKEMGYTRLLEGAAPPSLSKSDMQFFKAQIDSFAKDMGLGGYTTDIVKLSGSLLVSVKIMMSVYRRIDKFVKYQEKGMISI